MVFYNQGLNHGTDIDFGNVAFVESTYVQSVEG